MNAKVIAVANHKGGVGKTTSVASIGAALARKGKRTLLIDLDSQQNLTFSLLSDEEVEVSVYDAILGKADLPTIQVAENLFLSPSSIDIAGAERDLAPKMGRERLLKRIIDKIGESYDYILLDCPPSLGIVTFNALAAATALIIPLTAEALPLKGLAMLEEVVEEVREAINPDLSISGVFVTRYNNRNLNNVVVDAISARYGSKVFSTKIRENIAVAEAPLNREDIFSYSPDSNGAKDYESLTEELISRMA